MFSIMFPNINPEIVHIGPLIIRWYAMAYIMGAVVGLFYVKRLINQTNFLSNYEPKTKKQFYDDLISYCVLGVLLGGRLGYVLFYDPMYYGSNPFEILALWHGGMSFHGGLLGVIFACYILGKKYKKTLLEITDIIAPAIPIGLLLGRIANFINGELYGHPTNLPWGVIFPNETLARHPSQIYEAFLEGIILFLILNYLWYKQSYENKGKISGYMIFFYAIFRISIEFVRIPNYYVLGVITSGQFLSIPLLLIGLYLIIKSKNVQSTTAKN